MKIEKMFISPEMAKQLLEQNTKNRNISFNRVTRYANDILNARWVEDTGELIKIDINNVIVDGQHRLSAIVKARKGIYCHIATDLSPLVFEVIDSGKSRNCADILTISGIPNATKVAAFIQSYNLIRSPYYRASKSSTENQLTPKMVLAYYNNNKHFIDEVIKRSSHLYNIFQRVWVNGEVTLFYGLLTSIDNAKGREFMRQVCQGTDVTNESIIVLRNRLISDKIHSSKSSLPSHRRALVIKTWNAFYTNKTIKSLKYNPEIEEYPKIIGLDW
jgi:hypothetical protein